MKAIEVKNAVIEYRSVKPKTMKRIIKIDFKERYRAIDNLSFNVDKGEIIGLIGQNGSGKSTLLKAIANIFSLDSGTINTFNNQVSLLSLGVGFDNHLSGYENIFLSGMLMGYDKKYIESKIDDIIEFSELKEFIYKQVGTYSSGMYSKLAFSIVVFLDTDILLIDEVLSVGDIHFRQKSYNKLHEFITNKNKTIIIVSHAISSIQDLCTKVLWLDQGKLMEYGDPKKVLRNYKNFMKGLE